MKTIKNNNVEFIKELIENRGDCFKTVTDDCKSCPFELTECSSKEENNEVLIKAKKWLKNNSVDKYIGKSFYRCNDRCKYHIINSFTDNDQTFLICKFFGIHKRFWNYGILTVEVFEDKLENELYSYRRIK